jgi:uncharacterized protein YndB with AHSA1/START domain
VPVSTTAIIEAPVEKVWGIVSDFPNLKRWHPQIDRCDTVGAGEGAVRTVHFPDWWAAERLDLLDDDNHRLGYSVVASSREPSIGVSGTISMTPEGDGTRVEWVSGQAPGSPYEEAVNAALAAYYPVRVGHLRAALGLPA